MKWNTVITILRADMCKKTSQGWNENLNDVMDNCMIR